jgi:ubiquinone/menaquinone biosynthesis C-methylase UbiE
VISEPDPYMMRRLREKFSRASIEAKVVDAPAEELPFPDASFDTVLSVHVLCSVADLPKSLSEVRRVLKPDGQFRFFDHVRSRSPIGAFAQDAVLPAWRWFGAGCHLNRDIAAAVEKAGFKLIEHERTRPFSVAQSLLICAFSRPHVFGVATPA